MLKCRGFALAAGLMVWGAAWTVASAQVAPPGPPTSPRPAGAVIQPFIIAGDRAAGAVAPPSLCPMSADPSPEAMQQLQVAAQAGLPMTIASAMAQDFQAAGGPPLYNAPQTAPVGALIIAGCVTKADPGNPAQRVVGMGLGASRLAAHVQIYDNRPSGLVLLDEFDVEVVGENKLPPIGPVGLAVHAMKGRHETLAADVDKLAKLIVRRVLTGPTPP